MPSRDADAEHCRFPKRSADRRFEDGQLMLLPLQRRTEVMMRTQAAVEQRVAVEQQVMRGDRGSDMRRGSADELHGLLRRDMLVDDA